MQSRTGEHPELGRHRLRTCSTPLLPPTYYVLRQTNRQEESAASTVRLLSFLLPSCPFLLPSFRLLSSPSHLRYFRTTPVAWASSSSSGLGCIKRRTACLQDLTIPSVPHKIPPPTMHLSILARSSRASLASKKVSSLSLLSLTPGDDSEPLQYPFLRIYNLTNLAHHRGHRYGSRRRCLRPGFKP